VVSQLLMALPVILLVCLVLARITRRFGQPAVIGEIVAGILLGPSALGQLYHHAYTWLFPGSLTVGINLLAQLGLAFFMFLVGYELELGQVRGHGRSILLISHVGVAVPLVSGVLLAMGMYRSLAPDGTSFIGFALFIGVSISITAFPVLARIVTDRNLDGTELGSMALAGAAIGDVTAWWLLAIVVTTVRNSSPLVVLRTIALTALFAAALVFAVRPALRHLLGGTANRRELMSQRLSGSKTMAVLLSAIMLSALATNRIGIHAIFGAFLLGTITPRGSVNITEATVRLRSVTESLLLPLFFVYSGLRTEVGLLGGGWRPWALCVLVVAVAVLAKWGGTTLASRLSGFDWHTSLSLGALMNCRGLTELIVLNVGLDLGVISTKVFTIFVLMALVSTVMTSPALTLINRWSGKPRQCG
jgi:Kef-type K+ transport system membrane component KefB